tara:strand:- start:3222 stop:4529 length:1308 start_codon:yes stop_codon:yes gene_type:complete
MKNGAKTRLKISELFLDKFWVLFFIFSLFSIFILGGLYFYAGQYIDIAVMSPLSDSISAAFGLPIALAGSVVAIVLARRAFEVAQLQAHNESLAHAEGIANTAAEYFWNFSDAVRRMEMTSDRLHRNFVLSLNNYSGDPNDQLSKVSSEIYGYMDEHVYAIQNFSDSILKLLRNPITRKSWDFWAKNSEDCIFIFLEALPKSNINGNPKAWMPVLFSSENNHATDYAQALAMWAQNQTAVEVFDSLLLVHFQQKIKTWKYDTESKMWEKKFHRVARSDPSLGWKAPWIKKMSTLELMSELRSRGAISRGNTQHAMMSSFRNQDADRRLLALGASLCLTPVLKSTNDGHDLPFVNFGAILLMNVSDIMPCTEMLKDIVRAALKESGYENDEIIKVTANLLGEMGVTECMPQWIKEASKNIRSHRDQILIPNPFTAA